MTAVTRVERTGLLEAAVATGSRGHALEAAGAVGRDRRAGGAEPSSIMAALAVDAAMPTGPSTRGAAEAGAVVGAVVAPRAAGGDEDAGQGEPGEASGQLARVHVVFSCLVGPLEVDAVGRG